ncbi:hypothetical protein NECAME_04508 [Necator americanus]|uniref:Uncharacterized protein n=1 Tax=Necator americanus TaxID=51031 RepID=W2SS62_NECAM|nr:hypothetical protein NECAME_04508 [Necator americanus]ETN72328.1 hypothetical protein NECAME_04508 [Necator americanus]
MVLSSALNLLIIDFYLDTGPMNSVKVPVHVMKKYSRFTVSMPKTLCALMYKRNRKMCVERIVVLIQLLKYVV